jgi:hypothetical protein
VIRFSFIFVLQSSPTIFLSQGEIDFDSLVDDFSFEQMEKDQYLHFDY